MVLHVAQNTPENTCNPCALAVIGLDHSLCSAEILKIPLFSAGQPAVPFDRPLNMAARTRSRQDMDRHAREILAMVSSLFSISSDYLLFALAQPVMK